MSFAISSAYRFALLGMPPALDPLAPENTEGNEGPPPEGGTWSYSAARDSFQAQSSAQRPALSTPSPAAVAPRSGMPTFRAGSLAMADTARRSNAPASTQSRAPSTTGGQQPPTQPTQTQPQTPARVPATPAPAQARQSQSTTQVAATSRPDGGSQVTVTNTNTRKQTQGDTTQERTRVITAGAQRTTATDAQGNQATTTGAAAQVKVTTTTERPGAKGTTTVEGGGGVRQTRTTDANGRQVKVATRIEGRVAASTTQERTRTQVQGDQRRTTTDKLTAGGEVSASREKVKNADGSSATTTTVGGSANVGLNRTSTTTRPGETVTTNQDVGARVSGSVSQETRRDAAGAVTGSTRTTDLDANVNAGVNRTSVQTRPQQGGQVVDTTTVGATVNAGITRKEVTERDGAGRVTGSTLDEKAKLTATAKAEQLTVSTRTEGNTTTTDRARLSADATFTATRDRDLKRDGAGEVISGTVTTGTSVKANAGARSESTEVTRRTDGSDTDKRIAGATASVELSTTEQRRLGQGGVTTGSTVTDVRNYGATGELSSSSTNVRRTAVEGGTQTETAGRTVGLTATFRDNTTAVSERDAQGRVTQRASTVDDEAKVTVSAGSTNSVTRPDGKSSRTAAVSGTASRTEKGTTVRDGEGRLVSEDVTRTKTLSARGNVGTTSETTERESAGGVTQSSTTSSKTAVTASAERVTTETRKKKALEAPTVVTQGTATTLQASGNASIGRVDSETAGGRTQSDTTSVEVKANVLSKSSQVLTTSVDTAGVETPVSTLRTSERAYGASVDARLGEAQRELPLTAGVALTGREKSKLTVPGVASAEVRAPRNAEDTLGLPAGTKWERDGGRTLKVQGGAGAETTDRVRGSYDVANEGKSTVTRVGESQVKVTVETSRATTLAGSVQNTEGSGKTAVTVGGSASRETRDKVITTATLDLKSPEGRAAYEAFLQGDAAPLQAIAANSGGGVETSGLDGRRLGATASLQAGISGNVTKESKLERLASSDDRVAKDLDRQELARTRAEAGLSPLQWQTRSGSFSAGAGGDVTATAGAFSFSGGFTAKRATSFSVTSPTGEGLNPVERPVDSAAGAAALPRGSEFTVAGSSELGGRGSAAFGTQVGVGGLGTVGVSAGVKGSASHSEEISVTVRKKDAQVVEVNLHLAETEKKSVSANAGIGFQPGGGVALASQGAGAAGALTGNTRVAQAASVVSNLGVGVELSRGRVREEGRDVKYRIDLSTEAGRQAYERIVRGDPTVAQDLSIRAQRGEQSGVSFIEGKETEKDQRTSALGLNIGPLSAGKKTTRTSEATTERTATESTTVARESLTSESKSLFGKRRSISVVAETSTRGEEAFSFRYTRVDKRTSEREVAELRNLGSALGVRETEARLEKGGGGGGVPGFGLVAGKNDYGRTESELSLNVTQEGLSRARSASLEEKTTAAGRARARLDGVEAPAWARNDANGAEARSMLGQIESASGDAKKGLEQTYQQRFGQKPSEARGQLREAASTARLLDQALSPADPQARADALVDEMQRRGFGYQRFLGTISELVGSRAVEVKALSITGQRVAVTAVDSDTAP